MGENWLQAFGDIPCSQITLEIVEEYLNKRSVGL